MKITDIVDSIIEKTNTNTSNASSHIGLSGVTAYHLLQGNLAVDNTVTTQGFGVYLYTGNTTTRPSITLGMDIQSQWGNDASETYGYLIEIKSRSVTGDWIYVDSIRGNTKFISSNTTTIETTDANLFALSTVDGITTVNIGTSTRTNTNAVTYVLTVYQTTHKATGQTNHNKTYNSHYNPFTGLVIDGYEGSGIAGHMIPHHLGRSIDFGVIKNLNASGEYDGWHIVGKSNTRPWTQANFLNYTDAHSVGVAGYSTEIFVNPEYESRRNISTNQYIMYGWANSYIDESNKLIGNYEVGVYQGTGTSGNKVVTRGKPAWLMIKRLDAVGDWAIKDNMRGVPCLYPHLSVSEDSGLLAATFNYDSFTITNTDVRANASGGQYLYMVAYDTNSNGGGGYYSRATDTTNLNISNAIIPYANGVDGNGSKITTLSKNETISGLTLTAGKNYVYSKNDGSYGVSQYAPNYGKTNPSNGGDFYNVITNKWYTSAGVEITESRNYLNHIVYADNDGSPLYVEELPKVEYKDVIKANEYRGKNACTAWVNFDGTTTPPTIRDSYNVSSVVRTATGYCYIVPEVVFDNVDISVSGITEPGYNMHYDRPSSSVNAIYIRTYRHDNVPTNVANANIQIFGGKL